MCHELTGRVSNIEILVCTGRSMLKKGEFFQLVSNLFCVVKRGFVEPCINAHFQKITLSRVEISRLFTRVFFSPKMFAGPAQTYSFYVVLRFLLRFLWSRALDRGEKI
jgi:hypothetical protein